VTADTERRLGEVDLGSYGTPSQNASESSLRCQLDEHRDTDSVIATRLREGPYQVRKREDVGSDALMAHPVLRRPGSTCCVTCSLIEVALL
jgi:hypothetical protein